MATGNSTPTVARLIVATTRALEHYEAGDLPAALATLDGIEADPLPERAEWIAAELERRNAVALAGGLVPAAARDWIAEARDRLRRELGAEVPGAVTPVPLALRSALKTLGA